MSRIMVIEPQGWPCKLYECPPGFFVYNERLCFKTEYDIFNEDGKYFWGGTYSTDDRDNLIVQPVMFRWENKEK